MLCHNSYLTIREDMVLVRLQYLINCVGTSFRLIFAHDITTFTRSFEFDHFISFSYQRTALHYAVFMKNHDLCSFLVEQGASIHVLDNEGVSGILSSLFGAFFLVPKNNILFTFFWVH